MAVWDFIKAGKDLVKLATSRQNGSIFKIHFGNRILKKYAKSHFEFWTPHNKATTLRLLVSHQPPT